MTIIRDANITPFYSSQIARIGQVQEGLPPEVSTEGTPALADQYGRYIVLVDGLTNCYIKGVDNYPMIHGSTLGFVNEGQIGNAQMHALLRVWGMNSNTQQCFFQIRLVDSIAQTGVIVASIPVDGNYGKFSQDTYIDFNLNGVTYDTMYFNISTVPDVVTLPSTPSLWLNYAYQGAQLVRSNNL
jgi:hypothetical protein